MSDRRPENSELLVAELNHNVSSVDPSKWHTRKATVDEVLAFVRRGVESGTIKGEERRMCDAHDDIEAYKNPDACRAGLNANDEAACVMVAYVLIGPVSDGGEG